MSEPEIIYDKYYEDLIKIYDNGGGWGGFYYGVFSSIINQNNFKKCAEVGIGYGFHAKEIMENTNLETLYLIDPMTYYQNDAFPSDVMQYGGFEKLIKNITNLLAPYKSKYTWFHQPSLTITNEQIPDGSLDAVFIDADHSYNAVSADLVFWWKKLRSGGWLLGDDYSIFPGTKQAVDEFAAINHFKLEFLYKENTNHPIYKFIKP